MMTKVKYGGRELYLDEAEIEILQNGRRALVGPGIVRDVYVKAVKHLCGLGFLRVLDYERMTAELTAEGENFLRAWEHA